MIGNNVEHTSRLKFAELMSSLGAGILGIGIGLLGLLAFAIFRRFSTARF